MQKSETPTCHFTPMTYEAGESSSGSDFSHAPAEWFTCRHCGCVKDMNGKVIPQDAA